MKRFLSLFLAATLPIFGGVIIPPTDIFPVNQGSILGRTSAGAGRAQMLTAGTGITIANGLISATGGGGGGAPTDATYITQTPNSTLSAEQALSLLGTGIVLNTTGTGALSIVTIGSGLQLVGSTLSATGGGGGGSGTVTSIPDGNTNGVNWTVATRTTTPTFTFSLGDNPAPANNAYTVSQAQGGLVLAGLSPSNGATNSTIIQAAFPAGVARHVVLPKGSWPISTTTIAMFPGSTLEGQGDSDVGTVLTYTGTGRALTVYSPSTTSLLYGSRIANIKFVGTSAALGLVSLSDTYRCIVENCTFMTATGGFAIELRNILAWTEGAHLSRNQVRDCRYHYKFTIDNDTDPARTSFGETRITGASSIMTGINDRVIYAQGKSYAYFGAFEIKINNVIPASVIPTTTKAAIIELGNNAAFINNRWDVTQELGEDRNFNRFKFGTDTLFSGDGRIVIQPATTMSPNLSHANTWDSATTTSAYYVGPSGNVSSGPPALGNVNPVVLTAGQPVYAQDAAATNAATPVLYLTDGTFRVNLRYIGTGRVDSLTLRVSTAKNAHGAAGSSEVRVIGDEVLAGAPVFNRTSAMGPAYLRFSTTNHNAYLVADMNNTVAGGVLYVTAEIESSSSAVVTGSDFGNFQPLRFFPNVGSIPLDAALVPAKVAPLYSGNSTVTNGQILIGNTTSGYFDKTTLTAGTGITIANTAGTITVNATGGGSGNVTVSGSPTSGQIAEWTTASNIQGLTATGTGSAVRATSPTFGSNITLASSATPATTTTASVAFDTNAWGASHGAIQVHDGTAAGFVVATTATDTPSNGQVPTWNTGGTITWESPSGSGNVTNSGTLVSGNIVVGGGTTVVASSNITISGNDLTVPGNITVNNVNTANLTISGAITGLTNGSYIKHARVTTGSIGAGATGLVTITWGTTFADANYTATASVVDSTTSASSLRVVHIESVSASAVTVRVENTSGGSLTGTVQCIALHDG